MDALFGLTNGAKHIVELLLSRGQQYHSVVVGEMDAMAH